MALDNSELLNHPFFNDSQTALSFLLPQLTTIEREVYKIRYPTVRYRELIPIVTEGNPWTPAVTYFSTDEAGRMDWFNVRGQDIPNAEITRAKNSTIIRMSAIGYEVDIEELAQAEMLGLPISNEKADAARFASERFVDQVALFGDVSVGFTGFLNNANVAIYQSTSNGAATPSTFYLNKTGLQIATEINFWLTNINTTTNTIELADTVLMPIPMYQYISTTPFNTFSTETILQYILKSNVWTTETGGALTVKGVRGLDKASAGGGGRMVIYRKDPRVLKMYMPMPYRFLRVFQRDPLVYQIPGIMRFGGVDVRLPGAMEYVDGVSA